MHEEHKKIIIDSIKNGMTFKIEISKDMANVKQNLFLKQLDFFLQISSISIAILGIGYLIYTDKVDPIIGSLSLIFSFFIF